MADDIHSMLVSDVLREAAARLQSAGVSYADSQVRILCAYAYGVSMSAVAHAQFLGSSCADLGDQAQYALFCDAISRRCKREPLQHITGVAPFRYLELAVGKGVFVPRFETELLVDEVLAFLGSEHGRQGSELNLVTIVDLCAGSGAVGLACADEIPNSVVYAVEKDEQAFAYLNRNARQVNLDNYHPQMGDACDASTLAQFDGGVDVVVSNPPYIPAGDVPEQPEVSLYDPALALYGGGEDGMAVPTRIITRAYDLLRSGGLLVMEHDISQGLATCEVARQVGFAQVETHKDLAQKDRYLRAVKA